MADRPSSGEILGVPYNFDKPSIRKLVSSYWKPGEGMLVEKPFGIGYTVNLANWRSWIVLAVAGALLFQERKSDSTTTATEDEDSEPVEVIVD